MNTWSKGHIRFGKWELLNRSQYASKFRVYRSCESGDEALLIRHVISYSDVIKIYMTLWVAVSHLSYLCAKFDAYRSYGIKYDHWVKGICDLVSGNPSTLVT